MSELSAEKLSEKWAHPALCKIWSIIQFPGYENGKPVLNKQDIEEISIALQEANEALNKPEIKALEQYLRKQRRLAASDE